MVKPDYYDKFQCTGSECINNCCRGAWDIEVDDEAYERFSKIEGEFGERVLKSIDDERVFIRRDGHCPMLNDNGLCEMVLNNHKLCVICDEYPRFTEYFDDYCERGISVSCEEAARIILANPDKTKLVGKSGECKEDIFSLLYNARGDIFDILQNRQIDILKRIRLVLDYGEKLQSHINENNFCHFTYEPSDRWSRGTDICFLFDFLKTLSILNDEWETILDRSVKCGGHIKIENAVAAEQLAVYFVFRYFLKAAFDFDAIGKLKLMAVSVIVILTLSDVCGGLIESARRYSVEIEHSEDNIETIYDEFIFNDEFSVENIINMLV